MSGERNPSPPAFASGAYMYSHGGTVTTLAKKYQAIYKTAGGVRGSLGWPVSAPTCTLPGGGCSMAFDHGTLYLPKTGTGYSVSNDAIAAAYAAKGGISGSLGWPRTNTTLIATTANGSGYAQGFIGGYIYTSSLGTFTFDVAGQQAYAAAGGVRGALGWPKADPVCDATGCTQAFQAGILYIPKTGKPFAVTESRIATYYADHGGQAGSFGYPTTNTVLSITTKNGRGYAQAFTGGYIYATSLGTYAVTGPILVKYRAAKAQNGIYGFPKSDATCDSGVCTQTFAHGTIKTP